MKKLIFVYGTLKLGHGNARVMGKSKLLGEAKAKDLKMYSLGGFPALVKGKGDVTGEVYEVNDENTLRDIYSLEGYTGKRDNPNNWYDTLDVETPYGTAELFYMKDENKYSDHPIVEDGIWKKRNY